MEEKFRVLYGTKEPLQIGFFQSHPLSVQVRRGAIILNKISSAKISCALLSVRTISTKQVADFSRVNYVPSNYPSVFSSTRQRE